jgi:hypothetical protein
LPGAKHSRAGGDVLAEEYDGDRQATDGGAHEFEFRRAPRGDQAPVLTTLSETLIVVRWPWNDQRIRSIVAAERRPVHLR